jgi:hypothetical protein
VANKEVTLSCPSAQPDMDGARVIGLLGGTPESPEIAYLAPGVELELSAATGREGIEPTRAFRFAARCEERRCTHFDGARCSLGGRVVSELEPIVSQLPACQIRGSCRWYAERGRDVCLRCPQVITMVDATNPLSRIATAAKAGSGS